MGRVWHEFEGRNRAILPGFGAAFVETDAFDGSFGEVKGGLDILAKGSGFSGFVNTGVKFNEDATTVTAKGGIHYRW